MNDFYKDCDRLILSLQGFNDKEYEAGGFALKSLDNKFKFIEVPNKHKGTSTGRALYEPVDDVFAKLLGPSFREGWQMYATFHTHPSFTAQYSGIDYRNLFDNAKFNYIKSVVYGQIVRYTWVDEINLEAETIYG